MARLSGITEIKREEELLIQELTKLQEIQDEINRLKEFEQINAGLNLTLQTEIDQVANTTQTNESTQNYSNIVPVVS